MISNIFVLCSAKILTTITTIRTLMSALKSGENSMNVADLQTAYQI